MWSFPGKARYHCTCPVRNVSNPPRMAVFDKISRTLAFATRFGGCGQVGVPGARVAWTRQGSSDTKSVLAVN